MFISLGAAMSVLLALHDCETLHVPWADIAARVGEKLNACRPGSQAMAE